MIRKIAFILATGIVGPVGAQDQVTYCEAPFPPNDASSYENRQAFELEASRYFDAVNRFYLCMSQLQMAVSREWNARIETEINDLRSAMEAEIERLRDSLTFERDSRLDELSQESEFVRREVNRVIEEWRRNERP